jgi:hypothetical protein
MSSATGSVLAREHDGDEIDTDGNLDNQGIYFYVGPAGKFSLTMLLLLCTLMTGNLSNKDLT